MADKYPADVYKACNKFLGTNFSNSDIDQEDDDEVMYCVTQAIHGHTPSVPMSKDDYRKMIDKHRNKGIVTSKMSVLDRLADRISQKECMEWKCGGCGKKNPNEFNICEKCGKIKSNEDATKEITAQVTSTEGILTMRPNDKLLWRYDFSLKNKDYGRIGAKMVAYITKQDDGKYGGVIDPLNSDQTAFGNTYKSRDAAYKEILQTVRVMTGKGMFGRKEIVGQTYSDTRFDAIKAQVKTIVESTIDDLFEKLVISFNLKEGGTAPEQELSLTYIKKQVVDFMNDFVIQNKFTFKELVEMENKGIDKEAQSELTDAGVPLDHVLGTLAQHFPGDFKINVDNLDVLIDELRKVISRPSGEDSFIENNREFEAAKKGSGG